jgi:lincosamide nucleotidyltransferase B/F
MDSHDFDTFTDRLRVALESSNEVLGLVTLGTTADSKLRDEWSDHDFWVITKPGAQDSLLNDLSWLPNSNNIAVTVCHGPRRRTVLYHDRHKVEFAVFDVNEAHEGKVQGYRVLIDRDRITELIESIYQETLKQAQLSQTRPDALQNLCVVVWSACERHSRGELLSARQYIDGFGVNQLLNLIDACESETFDGTRDELDPRRRLELRSPKLAAEILTIHEEPALIAALRVLEIAERELKPKAPTLAWDKVAMVSEWIKDILVLNDP